MKNYISIELAAFIFIHSKLHYLKTMHALCQCCTQCQKTILASTMNIKIVNDSFHKRHLHLSNLWSHLY